MQLLTPLRHRRTHETQSDGSSHFNSEEDLENEENEFGSMDDELTSPEEMTSHKFNVSASMSMPPPSTSSMPLPQPMLNPSQLIQPQMLQQIR